MTRSIEDAIHRNCDDLAKQLRNLPGLRAHLVRAAKRDATGSPHADGWAQSDPEPHGPPPLRAEGSSDDDHGPIPNCSVTERSVIARAGKDPADEVHALFVLAVNRVRDAADALSAAQAHLRSLDDLALVPEDQRTCDPCAAEGIEHDWAWYMRELDPVPLHVCDAVHTFHGKRHRIPNGDEIRRYAQSGKWSLRVTTGLVPKGTPYADFILEQARGERPMPVAAEGAA